MKRITDHFYVSEQISVDDIPKLSQAGITHLICNRPDMEVEGQPLSKDIQMAAEQNGMSFIFQPIIPGQFSDASVTEFKASLHAQGKTLAFCRTGTRSLSLWVLSNPEQKTRAELLQLSEAAGYNMTSLIDRVQE
ncbi:MAG: TIGR01244 family phosphatase [Marinomonas sp.]|uniref:TIGR01244 family sulfur transferase n=1 Tax=Marinomonas communis TaxID=28254 RepID=UPI000C480EA0|nr:TIGR01244 family sulfur transferase [Marinomonas communis]MAF16068.1 TIGR01244 family phosphatase [Marinomonas sp.]MCC4275318.1 TIGR01244 family phosphatase [Marinomonas communis]RUM51186.1 MAG: TIGR01244 family phosphatase [Marinomonas sp.]